MFFVNLICIGNIFRMTIGSIDVHLDGSLDGDVVSVAEKHKTVVLAFIFLLQLIFELGKYKYKFKFKLFENYRANLTLVEIKAITKCFLL